MIFFKRDKLETQLAILGPRRGHALKIDQEHPALIPLIRIIFGTKCKQRNYNEILMNQKQRNTTILDF
jgi:hypothetical protein